MKQLCTYLLSISIIFLCYAFSFAETVDLSQDNFSYDNISENGSMTYVDSILTFDTTNEPIWATLKRTFSLNDNIIIRLDYSNFVNGGDKGVLLQMGLISPSAEQVKIQREYTNWGGHLYRAYQWPNGPTYIIPTVDTSGTFVLEKMDNEVALYVEGPDGEIVGDEKWIFNNTNFDEEISFRIDAAPYSSGEVGILSVDLSNLDIKPPPPPQEPHDFFEFQILDVANGTITVDGAPVDWKGIQPFRLDIEGDSECNEGTDIKALYLARDEINLYWRLDTWSGSYYFGETGSEVGPVVGFNDDCPVGDTAFTWSMVGPDRYEQLLVRSECDPYNIGFYGQGYGIVDNIAEGFMPLSLFDQFQIDGVGFAYTTWGPNQCDEDVPNGYYTSYTEIDTIPVGIGPTGITVNDDGSTVYVTNQNEGTITVMQTSENNEYNVVHTILDAGGSPSGIAINGDYIYVTDEY
ncbi:YncE family protein [Thermodesulfobacteriota bacterium]